MEIERDANEPWEKKNRKVEISCQRGCANVEQGQENLSKNTFKSWRWKETV